MQKIKTAIKKLDVYQVIPDEMKESSVFGVCLSFLFIAIAAILLLNQIGTFLSPGVYSEVTIDH
jgi:hypothetical protein